MNQSIRCQLLPFPMMSEKAAGEAALSPNAEKSDFGEILDSELEEPGETEKKRKSRQESEAWSIHGVAPAVIQILQVVPGQGAAEGEGEAAPASMDGEQGPTANLRSTKELASDASQPGQEPVPAREVEGAEAEKRLEAARAQIVARLKASEAGEQKMPPGNREMPPALAQIASKGVEPAKIASGMVAAQRPPMLFSSSKQEENAPHGEQQLSLGMERLESSALERPTRVLSPGRESAPKNQFELAEASAMEAGAPEWSSFEAVSEGQDLQPARPVEAAVLVEAIRTPVQLLKSSSQQHLDVVLRPDAHTELHLRVENVNGKIQVHARCDRGDFALLDANWNAVQSTLAMQGIRVEPLQSSGGAHFQQHSPGSEHSQNSFDEPSNGRRESDPFFIEQEFTKRKGTRPQATHGSAVRGWQSWA